jgi:hypothetical protein
MRFIGDLESEREGVDRHSPCIAEEPSGKPIRIASQPPTNASPSSEIGLD